MLEFELGCYKSYPLTGISSRDSGLASKEIRIGLEFKNGVLHFPSFGSFLVYCLLKPQLIQNLWNLLEISKICMEHGVKLILFPRS